MGNAGVIIPVDARSFPPTAERFAVARAKFVAGVLARLKRLPAGSRVLFVPPLKAAADHERLFSLLEERVKSLRHLEISRHEHAPLPQIPVERASQADEAELDLQEFLHASSARTAILKTLSGSRFSAVIADASDVADLSAWVSKAGYRLPREPVRRYRLATQFVRRLAIVRERDKMRDIERERDRLVEGRASGNG